MASVSQVRAYLAYWFQLGKPIVFQKEQNECLPCPIFQGDRFSQAFETCWQRIVQNASDCYLQGTDQTAADLLTENWEITGCARCTMPVPMPVNVVAPTACPCHDLPLWPNNEVPQPRMRINGNNHLEGICDRLSASSVERDRLRSAYLQSPDLPKLTTDEIPPKT
ncbi:MAG: hypothetical protein F6J95_010795 [Leptolyngbya sp. SIO1E4]|nr:hypothetical protein [Leptolyngbya sp. SIO1E4]